MYVHIKLFASENQDRLHPDNMIYIHCSLERQILATFQRVVYVRT